MSKALLIAKSVSEAAALAEFARQIGKPFDVLCFGDACPTSLAAEKVFCAEGAVLPADSLTNHIANIADEYDIIAGIANMFGKDVLARIAGRLDLPMVGDILEVHDSQTFTRPMFAGNILAKVHVESPRFVCTIRAASFPSQTNSGESPVEKITIRATGTTKRIAENVSVGGRPELTQARVVVSGGRPLKDAATYERIIGGLADALGGGTGATRAAVDSGIAPNDSQVGQTGKIVAPELYIAAGVSGSTQHIAGMKESKVIVAVNTDAEAPIFEVADYGLVMDLFVALPELTEKIKAR